MSYEMTLSGSCFIGGASAYGGSGTVPGIVVGAILLGVINQGMSIYGLDNNWQYVVKGARAADRRHLRRGVQPQDRQA